jgi:hypothetical protein
VGLTRRERDRTIRAKRAADSQETAAATALGHTCHTFAEWTRKVWQQETAAAERSVTPAIPAIPFLPRAR